MTPTFPRLASLRTAGATPWPGLASADGQPSRPLRSGAWSDAPLPPQHGARWWKRGMPAHGRQCAVGWPGGHSTSSCAPRCPRSPAESPKATHGDLHDEQHRGRGQGRRRATVRLQGGTAGCGLPADGFCARAAAARVAAAKSLCWEFPTAQDQVRAEHPMPVGAAQAGGVYPGPLAAQRSCGRCFPSSERLRMRTLCETR